VILVAGALRAEVGPLIDQLDGRERIGRRLVRGHLDGVLLAVLRCGVGPERAQERTTAAVKRWAPERVLSIGTCGSLTDELAVGDVVSASEVSLEGGGVVPSAPLLHPRSASLVTVASVVWDATRRDALRAAGHHVCDMEAAGVGRAAGPCPFSALKVVSDLAGRDAPRRPRPIDIAAFQLLARRLSERALVPALRQALARP